MATIETKNWTRVIRNATLATCVPGKPYGAIPRGAIALAGDRIAWVGKNRLLPEELPKRFTVTDARGALITPGLIDCHTHLVWAGSRHLEFEQRLMGASYEDIARAGGGIASTVTATRAASENDLLTLALARAGRLAAEGVTTIEIKSGYGLDRDNELKMLRVARKVGERLPLTVRTTLLAAHAVPPEFKDRADDYIRCVVDDILPAAAEAGLVDAVDAFCENIGFTPAQVERVFTRARELRLAVKLHAEQLSNQNGAALAAKFRALSADHLEHPDKAGVEAMARAGTVAGNSTATVPARAIASTPVLSACSRWSAESALNFAASAAPFWFESCSACSLTASRSSRARVNTRSTCAGVKPMLSQKASTASTSPASAAAGRMSSTTHLI